MGSTGPPWRRASRAATPARSTPPGTTGCTSSRSRRGRRWAAPATRSTRRPRSSSPGRRRCMRAAGPASGAAATTSSTDEGPRCPPPLARSRRAPAAGPFLTGFLGPAAIRELARQLELRPTKTLGQNFLHDANTIRRIVRTAELRPDDVVLEIGPGLGSLTLGLLPAVRRVTAVEIDPRLASLL